MELVELPLFVAAAQSRTVIGSVLQSTVNEGLQGSRKVRELGPPLS